MSVFHVAVDSEMAWDGKSCWNAKANRQGPCWRSLGVYQPLTEAWLGPEVGLCTGGLFP